MAWRKWLQGLVVSIANTMVITLGTIVFVPGDNLLEKLKMAGAISVFPTLVTFFSYIKEHSIPINGNQD